MLKTLSIASAVLGLAALGITPASATGDYPTPQTRCDRDDVTFLSGGPGIDRLIGTPGNDWIAGRGGNDVVRGDACNDYLWGGTGNDRVWGVDGYVDRLIGGRGSDTCVGDDTDVFINCERIFIGSPFPKR